MSRSNLTSNFPKPSPPLYATPIDRKRAIAPQMAKAIVAIAMERGSCSTRQLIGLGFTPFEVARWGGTARTQAVALRPDLAHDGDRAHAANDHTAKSAGCVA